MVPLGKLQLRNARTALEAAALSRSGIPTQPAYAAGALLCRKINQTGVQGVLAPTGMPLKASLAGLGWEGVLGAQVCYLCFVGVVQALGCLWGIFGRQYFCVLDA
jgi:hypothetical protein